MELTSHEEIWRKIPPEEKLELLSKAHAQGLLWAISIIMLSGTLAVAFQAVWLFWFFILSAPLIFQATAGKAWRGLRPIVTLEYLGARAAARRYAFVVRSENLYIEMLFKGEVEHLDAEIQVDDLYPSASRKKTAKVWVALFGDAVVMLSERMGGAELQFGHLLNDKLTILSNRDEIGTDYSNQKEVVIEYEDKQLGTRRVRLVSRYPAALIVFEKKMREAIEMNTAAVTFLDTLGVEPTAIAAKVDEMPADSF